MASFSMDVESILDIDTSENVLLVAQWIKDSMLRAGHPIKQYKFHVLFTSGELTVTCENEKEFKALTLGQKIEVNNYNLFINVGRPDFVFFHISKKRAINDHAYVSVSCNDRSIIQEVTSAMRAAKEKIAKDQPPHTSEIVIQGDNNQIGVINAGDNNTINNTMQSTPKVQSGFWHGVLQFIVSNIIWVIIVAVIIIIITVLGITQPDWLRF